MLFSPSLDPGGLPKSSGAGCCCTLAEHFASRWAQRAWKGWGWTECWHPSEPRGSPKSGRAAKHWSSTEATWAKQRQKRNKNITSTIMRKEREKTKNYISKQTISIMGLFILSYGHSIIYKTNCHTATKLQGMTWIRKGAECMQKTATKLKRLSRRKPYSESLERFITRSTQSPELY